MLDAILKGKISSQTDGKEDLLTSVVFGVLKYLPPMIGIGPVLALARDTDEHAIPDEFLHPARVHVEFWPPWNEAEAKYGAEPDAVLWCDYPNGRRIAFVVEAKRDSGKHGEGDRDQLVRQVANGMLVTERDGYTLAGLLYVTADIAIPTDELTTSADVLQGEPGLEKVPLWWVSWRDLGPVLDEAAARMSPPLGEMAHDAAACLRKWGLDRYQGITARIGLVPEYTFQQTSPLTATGAGPARQSKEGSP